MHLCHLTPKRSLHSGLICYDRGDWKAANSDTSDDSKPSPPSEGEKYNQIRTKSWILGPVATKWSFRQGCFALVSKLLLLFVQ